MHAPVEVAVNTTARLGARFEANPALVLHFPERAPVRDVALRAGAGIIVGDLDGDDPVCFFWNTADRLYIVTASHVSEQDFFSLPRSGTTLSLRLRRCGRTRT